MYKSPKKNWPSLESYVSKVYLKYFHAESSQSEIFFLVIGVVLQTGKKNCWAFSTEFISDSLWQLKT